MFERRWLLNSDIHSNSLIPHQKVLIPFCHYFMLNTAKPGIFFYIWCQQ